MKCTNKLLFVSLILLALASLCGCGSSAYRIPYDASSNIRAYSFDSYNTDGGALPFAFDICVADEDIKGNGADIAASSAALFNVTGKKTEYAKSVNRTLHPASLTKIMTAYLALKYGKSDDILTASSNIYNLDSGAQVCGFEEGDQLTLEQVLYGLLLYSGNDAGIMIAEYISGSVEEFADLMNKEALMLGATNTHFTNPHGLTDENHYTTAYDLYLIFNAALKYDKFKEIIRTSEYKTTYTDKNGNAKDIRFSSTNYYISGATKSPKDVNVLGGKTGSTKAAGNCLILLSTNASGENFISIVMNSEDRDTLYSQMNNLLKLEP